MLIVQKYNSLSEIESEFRESIEKLLSTEIVSFEALLKKEQSKPQSKFFYYYLFFSNSTNLPVGYACFEYEKLDPKKYIPWQKRVSSLFSKKTVPTLLRLSSDTQYRNFFTFEPKHLKLGLIEIKKLIHEHALRPGVIFHEVMMTPYSKPVLVDYLNISSKENLIQIVPFKKTLATYQDYFENLDSEAQGLVKLAWKKFTKDLQLELKDSNDELLIQNQNSTLLKIELNLSKQKVLFVDFDRHEISHDLDCFMILQNILMKFYEMNATDLVINNKLSFSSEDLATQKFMPYSIDRILKGMTDFSSTKIFDEI